MTFSFSALTLALFGVSLILITLSLRYLRGTSGDSYHSFAKFFLICLRLAIGWHCFIEGMEKLNTPNWSSEAYLRESVGPFSEVYRNVAGDRLLAKVTLGPNDTFPAELDGEWRDYLKAFAAYYNLDSEQLQRAETILEQRKADTLAYLKSAKETVTKLSPHPPELKLEMTMAQRVKEHDRLLEKVRAIEATFPSSDKEVHADWKSAKADLAKWRGELKRSIDAQSAKLKMIDSKLKDQVTKAVAALNAKGKGLTDSAQLSKLKSEIELEAAKIWTPLGEVLTSEQKLLPPMPEPHSRPIESWRELEWSDALVKWGLLVLGTLLMLGLFSRLSSFATALLILSFYLAMPPLPGWPESPRLEGHYLLINKTLIEVIALFALTFIPTGRWAGIDGLLCACCGKSNPQAPG
jgi:uncharacterized membrane protein YphA (DoxX/SURF4 family)